MISLLFLGIGLVLLIGLIAAVVIFLRAAFWSDREAAQAAGGTPWRPPFQQGGELRSWAAGAAERTVAEQLAPGHEAPKPADLVRQVGDGAVQAMLPLARAAEWERVIACPEAGQGALAVTGVEALAIADELRKTHSSADVERIQAQALANAHHVAGRATAATAPGPCPLQGEHQICCVYAARPLQCRPLHALGASSSAELAHVREVGAGVREGLARGLSAAGRDGRRYEFNSALARALATPDASVRWGRGEDVFGGCTVIGA